MTCLLYGIVFSQSGDYACGHSLPLLPAGVGGAAVKFIKEGGLGAAVSWIDSSELTPNIARVLSYGKVVEALHADRAVIPMRYGCLFREQSEVVELLRVHSRQYAAILCGLDGCVEIGVRVLLPAEPSGRYPDSVTTKVTGRSYLSARAACYAKEEQEVRALAATTERLRGTLVGLAERTETDRCIRAGRGLCSLYFLVRREQLESFRQAFRWIERAESARLLLSGPWPPYNFVAPNRHWDEHG